MIELFQRFPRLASCPHRRLGDFPTPVRSSPELARWLGAEEVWVKCDDLSSQVYGGNKVRKLEFLLADALARGYTTVWTVGAIGSHHVLATALYATRLGLKVEVRQFHQPVTALVRQTCLAIAATGAKMSLCGRWALPWVVGWQSLACRLGGSHRSVYYIPGGGSSPVGCLGYVDAALELASQLESGELPRPDLVYVPVGTAGTLVGLLVGFKLAGLDIPIVGVRVVDRILVNRIAIQRLVLRTSKRLEEHGVPVDCRLEPGAFRLDHSQFGLGYAVPTESSRQAVRLAKAEAGLDLENTYTGKTMAALLSLRSAGGATGLRLLFWNTYNSQPIEPLIPAGFSYRDLPGSYHPFFVGEVGE